MEDEKKTLNEETEVKEPQEETPETETETETKTETEPETESEAKTETELEATEEQPVKVSSKRIKKAQRREAKAARKAANKIEEKKNRPNNALIALMIFGVLVGMFLFVLGYNYFSKPANIEKFLDKNGGKEVYSNVQLDMYSTANITAKGNSLKIDMTVNSEDENTAKLAKDFYASDDGEEQLKQTAAYILTEVKPQTRAFSADVNVSVKSGKKEIQSVKMTYKEAKDYIEELQEKAEKEAEDAQSESGGTEEADAETDAEESEAPAEDAEAAE